MKHRSVAQNVIIYCPMWGQMLWCALIMSSVVTLGACAAQVGNINDNIGLVSHIPEPTRLAEPSRLAQPSVNGDFPKVTSLVDRSRGRNRIQLASVGSWDRHPAAAPAEPSDRSTGLGSASQSTANNDSETQDGQEQQEPTPVAADSMGSPLASAKIIPSPLPGADEDQMRFHQQASRAVMQVHDNSLDDPSIARALLGELIRTPSLGDMVALWRRPLKRTIRKAKDFQDAGWAVRRLRKAFEAATFDADMSIYRGVHIRECRLAFKRLYATGKRLLKLEVVIEPVGKRTLADFEIACNDSHAVMLMEHDFPVIKGPKRLRRLAKKAYKRSYRGRRAHRVTIKGGWVQSANGKSRTLSGSMGVERRNAFPEDPCVVEDFSIKQHKTGGRWGRLICCEIKNSTPIACGAIK